MSLLLAATEAVTEHSKAWYEHHLPYYIAAGLTALWAFGIGIVGIRNHSLPKSDGLFKGMMAVTAVLVACTIGFAIGTGETPDLNQTRPKVSLGVVPQPDNSGGAAAGQK